MSEECLKNDKRMIAEHLKNDYRTFDEWLQNKGRMIEEQAPECPSGQSLELLRVEQTVLCQGALQVRDWLRDTIHPCPSAGEEDELSHGVIFVLPPPLGPPALDVLP